jgi:hypothetical protein
MTILTKGSSVNDADKKSIYAEFKKAVNMTAYEIEAFLKTDDSKKVGQKPDGGGESIGHASGRKIIAILNKKQADLTDADYDHMKHVNSYVKRHMAQGPSGDKRNSRWRYSLMNWGHDPLK